MSRGCKDLTRPTPIIYIWDNRISQKVFSRDYPQAGYIIII